jgi:hypothetical protein
MENDVKERPEIESDCKQAAAAKTHVANTIIDTINNNINCLIERIQSENSGAAIDESSLPSPRAMLETIMPCEKLCQNFRHIADDDDEGDVLKTVIKVERGGVEPKLAVGDEQGSGIDGIDLGEQFPLNLKNFKCSNNNSSSNNNNNNNNNCVSAGAKANVGSGSHVNVS